MSTEKWRKTFHPFRQWGDYHRSSFGVKNSSYFSLFIIVPSFFVMKTSTIILAGDHRRFIQSLESHYVRDFSLLFLLGRDYETHHELLLLGLRSGWSEKKVNAEWSRVVYLFRLMTFLLSSLSELGRRVHQLLYALWLFVAIKRLDMIMKYSKFNLSAQVSNSLNFNLMQIFATLFFFLQYSTVHLQNVTFVGRVKGKQVKLCRWQGIKGDFQEAKKVFSYI